MDSIDDPDLKIKTVTGKPLYVMPWRSNYKGDPIKVFTSFGARPKLTEQARREIFIDS